MSTIRLNGRSSIRKAGEKMELTELPRFIEFKSGDALTALSPLKIKAILFFSQIDYYTMEGEVLFSNPIRCYHNALEIEGLEIKDYGGADAPYFTMDSDVEEILSSYYAFFEEAEDAAILDYLYTSKAFLRSNLARGNRLTKRLMQEYHDLYSGFSHLESFMSNQVFDEVHQHDHLVDTLLDDLKVKN